MLDIDIADIECRHAWVRRHAAAKSSTWSADCAAISSDFLVMRWRQLLRENWFNDPLTSDSSSSDSEACRFEHLWIGSCMCTLLIMIVRLFRVVLFDSVKAQSVTLFFPGIRLHRIGCPL
jgi:hypothetical protein